MPPNATTTTTTASLTAAAAGTAEIPTKPIPIPSPSPPAVVDTKDAADENNNNEVFVYTSGSVTAETSIVEYGKSYHSTGICFLDHMVDQLTSHGQLGVTMKVFTTDANTMNQTHHEPRFDYAGGSLSDEDRIHDEDIFIACGATLGMALQDLVQLRTKTGRASPTTSSSSSDEEIKKATSKSVFCCPLDESFCEVKLEMSTSNLIATAAYPEFVCNLGPYGSFASSQKEGGGRRWIGCYKCDLTSVFFENLSISLGSTNLSLRKVRGRNAHHIVESAFKSFARAFRACLDQFTMEGHHGCVVPEAEGPESRLLARRRKQNEEEVAQQQQEGRNDSNNATDEKQQQNQHRTGSRSRSTKETTIDVHVDLDKYAPHQEEDTTTTASSPSSSTTTTSIIRDITTGVELTDLILNEIRECAGFYFGVNCDGDVYIDDHHTSEDVAITLGQCLNQALGNKAGLARMGCAEIPIVAAGGANNNSNNNNSNSKFKIRCVMDLSNRPYFEWNLPLDEEYVGGDEEAFDAMRRGAVRMNNRLKEEGKTTTKAAKMLCGSALTCEMLHHVFESLTTETRATVHMELLSSSSASSGKQQQEEVELLLYEPYYPGHTKDLAIAAAKAFGTALSECVRIDPRRAGKVASSKGTLSV